MKQLEWLLKEVKKVKLDGGEIVAKYDLKPGDVFVGILPEDLQRLCTIYLKIGEKLADLRKQLKASLKGVSIVTKDDIEEVEKQYNAELEKSHFVFVSGVFWSAVKCVFPQIKGTDQTYIRKGWSVVCNNNDREAEHACIRCRIALKV